MKVNVYVYGFARALEECAKFMGLEIKTISGTNEKTGHAWNQVKIGNKWFNCDLTWERSFIIESDEKDLYKVLKNAEQFHDHDEFKKRKNEEICDTDIEDLISEYQHVKKSQEIEEVKEGEEREEKSSEELALGNYVKNKAHVLGIEEIKSAFKKLQETLKGITNKLLKKRNNSR